MGQVFGHADNPSNVGAQRGRTAATSSEGMGTRVVDDESEDPNETYRRFAFQTLQTIAGQQTETRDESNDTQDGYDTRLRELLQQLAE